MTKKSRQWNKKHFSSFLKGFQLLKIFSDLRVHLWQSPFLGSVYMCNKRVSGLGSFQAIVGLWAMARVEGLVHPRIPPSGVYPAGWSPVALCLWFGIAICDPLIGPGGGESSMHVW